MRIEIKVWSDFVCPFCLIAERPLQDAVRESGLEVDIVWMPFELRPYPTPTLKPEDSYLQTVWPRAVYPMAERYDVAIRLPGISPQPHTGLAWEGYRFAQEFGKGNAYNDRVLSAFFQDELDIGDPRILARLAAEVGLDAAAFAKALDERRYREAHQRALADARAQDVTAVPTFMIGDTRLSGVQPKEALLRALRDASAAHRPGGHAAHRP